MWCSAGGDLLRKRRPSLASSSTGRLLSLAEAQERERAQSASVGFIEVGGGPSALPSKYHTVVDFPKRSVVVQFCYYGHTAVRQVGLNFLIF